MSQASNKFFNETVSLLRAAMVALSWDDYKKLIARLHKTLTDELERIK